MTDNDFLERPGGRPPLPDPKSAHSSRTYDYHLGGKDHLGVDRGLVDEVENTVMPDAKQRVRAQRRFLERAVRHLVGEAGIWQILDIGCGLPQPVMPNVHEIALEIEPAARVVYVDNNPVAVAHMAALQTDGAQTVAFPGDLRRLEDILDHPQTRATLDFTQPIGVLLVGLLHWLPDEDDPAGLIDRLRRALPSGSYVVVSQISADLDPRVHDVTRIWGERGGDTHMVQRSRAELEPMLEGFELVEPRWVTVDQWRPDGSSEDEGNTFGLVGRKRE